MELQVTGSNVYTRRLSVFQIGIYLCGIFIILLLFCFRQYSFFIIFDRSRSNPYHRIFELLAQVLCFVTKLPVFMCSQKISN